MGVKGVHFDKIKRKIIFFLIFDSFKSALEISASFELEIVRNNFNNKRIFILLIITALFQIKFEFLIQFL